MYLPLERDYQITYVTTHLIQNDSHLCGFKALLLRPSCTSAIPSPPAGALF